MITTLPEIDLLGEKKTRTEIYKREYPICCYCGVNSTETIDHCPPKILFYKKHRPKGFEFPACRECNRRSSVDDNVAAFIFGLTLSGKLSQEPYISDFFRKLKSVEISAPHVINETFLNPLSRSIEKREIRLMGMNPFDVKLVNVGRETRRHLYNFSAKLIIAAYFYETKKICRPTTTVSSVVMLNHKILRDGLPEFPFDYEGYFSLQKGKLKTDEQFSFLKIVNLEESIAHYRFQFHQNAVVFGFLSENGFETDLGDPLAHRKFGNLFI